MRNLTHKEVQHKRFFVVMFSHIFFFCFVIVIYDLMSV